MEKRTDKNLYTLLFATGMVIVVGSLLAFLASSLKPNINENKQIEKQKRKSPQIRTLSSYKLRYLSSLMRE